MPHKKKISVIAIFLIIIGFTGTLLTAKSGDDMAIVEETFQDDMRHLNIKIDNGKVKVLPSNEDNIRLELEAINPEEKVETNMSDHELTITVTDNQKKWYNFGPFNATPKLRVYIPEIELEKMMVNSDNGSIHVENIQSKNITTETDNGYIKLDGVTSSTVNVLSNNGKIDVIDIAAADTTVSTDNGKIVFDHVGGDIIGRASNGAITLKATDIDRNIDLQTSNGKILVQTKNRPTNTIIDVQVGVGKARVFGESNWDTVIGDGNHLVKLTTSNGSITIE